MNLTGAIDPIHPSLIQLTRALLALGTIQARRLPKGSKGLIRLDPKGQLLIAETWMREVQKIRPTIPPFIKGMLDEGYRKVCAEVASPNAHP